MRLAVLITYFIQSEKKAKAAENKRVKGVKLPFSPGAAARMQLNDDASTINSDMNVFDRLKVSQSQDPVKLIATFQHGAIGGGMFLILN